MYPVLNFLPWGMVAILSCMISAILLREKKTDLNSLDLTFILFSIVTAFSIVFAWDTGLALKKVTTIISWLILYYCVKRIVTTPNRIMIFIIFFLIFNFKLSQHGARSFASRGFTFAQYGLTGSPGWFQNSGEFSLQMVVMFSFSYSLLTGLKKYVKSLKRWWVLMFLFPGTAALTIIGASSRGGQLALLIVIFLILLKDKKQLLKYVFLMSIVAFGAVELLPQEQKERFTTMGEDETSQLRFKHWEAALVTIEKEPMGIGYSNWSKYYPANFDIPSSEVEVIHNTVLQAYVELGHIGGFIFLLLIVITLSMNRNTYKELINIGNPDSDFLAHIASGLNLGLIGAFIASMFMSILWYPVFWLAFCSTSALRNIAISYRKNEISLDFERNDIKSAFLKMENRKWKN